MISRQGQTDFMVRVLSILVLLPFKMICHIQMCFYIGTPDKSLSLHVSFSGAEKSEWRLSSFEPPMSANLVLGSFT